MYEISNAMFLTARSAGIQLDELVHMLTHRPTMNAVVAQCTINALGTDATVGELRNEYAVTRPILGSAVGLYVYGRRHGVTGLELGLTLAFEAMELNDAAVALIPRGFPRDCVLSTRQVEALTSVYSAMERESMEAVTQRVLDSLQY